MSYASPLAERERALEEAFFRKENQRLLAEMRARETRVEQRLALAEVLGSRDEKILDPLLDAWSSYVSELCVVLSPGARTRLRNDIVRWSWRVAEAIGRSMLRSGAPTRAERAVIDQIELTFRSGGDHGASTERDPLEGIDEVFSSMS